MVNLLAQALVIVYPPVFVFWVIIHTRIDFWRKLGKRAYVVAVVAWPLISGPLFLLRDKIFAIRWEQPRWLMMIGVAALISAGLVFWQASLVISNRTLFGLVELEPQVHPQPVMQTGIYARTRNPVYLAHWLLIVAAACLSGYAANWVMVAAEVILIWLLIRIEERELLARYGDEFRDYMHRVPRFLPRLPW